MGVSVARQCFHENGNFEIICGRNIGSDNPDGMLSVETYHPERTKPTPTPHIKRVHTWSPAQEAEMERLINTLDWNDPSACRNPRVIKYELCDFDTDNFVNDD